MISMLEKSEEDNEDVTFPEEVYCRREGKHSHRHLEGSDWTRPAEQTGHERRDREREKGRKEERQKKTKRAERTKGRTKTAHSQSGRVIHKGKRSCRKEAQKLRVWSGLGWRSQVMRGAGPL